MITFVLADAQLELVPPELVAAPSVKRRARERRREPAQILLDQAQDHRAMRDLSDGDRRGRPDIVHFALLLLQDSPLEKRVFIHTREDELIRVRPDLRPPRSQPKFYQLCEDLLRQGKVPMDRTPLMTLEKDWHLWKVLAAEAKGPTVLLDEGGELARSAAFADMARASPDITLVVGAFPRGEWRERPKVDRVVRVADKPLPLWSALVPVLAGFEDAVLG
ncbi:MAG TPA: 16S rRNA methyltransferase [Candidatus Thermoplasmatota archaeon]|nr:16S rRNA methyltransferase [Candidatus Thermoplasmatota archaeon]